MPQPLDHLQGITVPSGHRVHKLVLMLPGCSFGYWLGESRICSVHLLVSTLDTTLLANFSLPIFGRPVCILLPLFVFVFVAPQGYDMVS
jgi:hypothetical protein